MQQNDGATPAPPERAEDIPPETGKKNDSYDVAAADAAVAAGAGAQVFENEPQRGVKDACGGKKLKKAVGAEGFVCLVLVAGFFVAFGCVMGFSNAINTMFNTATVVGVGVNIHGAGFPRNFVASFIEGGTAGFTDVQLTKFYAIAEKMMARRGRALTEADKTIFEAIYNQAEQLK